MAPESPAAIEVRVEDLSQLFDTLDPFPFRERDLDKDAEEFIVGWARELPKDQPIRIVVHLRESEAAMRGAGEIEGAMKRYFDYRAGMISRDINELFRVGRRALVIGLLVLAACVAANRMIAMRVGSSGFAGYIEESLVILGWVANWKPIEIFLYDWWPIARRRNLCRRLAAASVQIRTFAPDGAA